MEYGGLGGVLGGREFNVHDRFEVDLNRALGDEMRKDRELAKDVWGALANVDWRTTDGKDTASYSFRAAGDMIAAIRAVPGEDYCTFYCSRGYARITDQIREAMAKVGWEPIPSSEEMWP